eukprot:GILI01038045.1.p1 GENE.GILI01038045.1~~GILI01038045.1.p1  ORF type:complete len:423 (+),score=100.24 GILI01038045.1:57-1271(+)
MFAQRLSIYRPLMSRTIMTDLRSMYRTLPGAATAEGTQRYSKRNPQVPAQHFRKPLGVDLSLSTMGVGTYLGAPDRPTDKLVEDAIVNSVRSGGFNVIDTALNYRYQKAERSVGRALAKLAEVYSVQRSELFVCTKNGYISDDADSNYSGEQLVTDLVAQGTITQEDVVQGIHCMAPGFLEDQLTRSLANLRLETIDLYYLYNTAQSQLPLIDRQQYFARLSKAFEFCEKKRQEGRIKYYGMASWMCFRADPDNEDQKFLHLNLEEVVALARNIGGADHGFKFVQAPMSLFMNEAFIDPFQSVDGSQMTLIEAAYRLGINLFASSPLYQSRLLSAEMPFQLGGVNSKALQLLQLIRSIPIPSVVGLLVGQKTPEHVTENIELTKMPPMTPQEWLRVLQGESEAP